MNVSMYSILTTDRRPTSHFENFKGPYLRNESSDQLHVSSRWVFGDGGSNGAISGSNKSKIAAAAIWEKFQMAISPQPVVRSSPCLVLGWGFRGRRI